MDPKRIHRLALNRKSEFHPSSKATRSIGGHVGTVVHLSKLSIPNLLPEDPLPNVGRAMAELDTL
jgi:hypothetical protein